MALVSIGSTILPTPSEYTALQADVVDSGRNANGVIVSSVVRSNVAKITMSWKYLTVEQWSDILRIFKSSFENAVTYFDQVEGTYVTKTMYISDRQGGLAQFKNGSPVGWINCSLSLVEV